MAVSRTVRLCAVVIFIVTQWMIGSASAPYAGRHKVHRGKSLAAEALRVLETATTAGCVMECRSDRSCRSVNVVKTIPKRLVCKILEVTANSKNASLQEATDTDYIEFIPEREGPADCEARRQGGDHTDGVYRFDLPSGEQFHTFCDMETTGGGWTVVQRRKDGSVDFYRGWQDYKAGFGNFDGEFWLGLDLIHNLTKFGDYTLRVDLWDDVEHRFAEYTNFTIACEADKYRLDYMSYEGTAGNSMGYCKRQAFSTYDQDNDPDDRNCPQTFTGAWWYARCHHSNLNGRYLNGAGSQDGQGVTWNDFRGRYYSLPRAEMKIKRM